MGKTQKEKNSELSEQLEEQKSMLTQEYDTMCEKLTETTKQLKEMKDGKALPDEKYPDVNIEEIEQKYSTQVKLLKDRLKALENIEDKLSELQERCEVDKESALKFERDCRCLRSERDVLA